MTATTDLARPDAAPDPKAFCHDRSSEELREIVSHGIAGGDLFLAANSEIERRAQEADVAIHDQEAKEAVRRRRITWVVAVLVVAAAALVMVRLLGL